MPSERSGRLEDENHNKDKTHLGGSVSDNWAHRNYTSTPMVETIAELPRITPV